MKKLTLLVLLLALPTLAQVTRGGALKKREYQTTSTIALYVDPAGSDSNACRAASSACLTCNGALNKLPDRIAGTVGATINFAAGTYAGTCTIDRFAFPGTKSVVGVTLEGALVAATVATGTSTGTLSAVTAPSVGVNLQGLGDGAQTWTTNNLKGKLIEITSGGANGQRRVIVSNTGTAIEVAGGYSVAPAVGATYAIKEQSVIFTGQLIIGAGLVPYIQPTQSSVAINRIKISTSTSAVDSLAPIRLTFTESALIGGNGTGIATTAARHNTFINTYVNGTLYAAWFSGCPPGFSLMVSATAGVNGALFSSAGGTFFNACPSTNAFLSNWGGVVMETTSDTGRALTLANTTVDETGDYLTGSIPIWIRCPTSSTASSGIYVNDNLGGSYLNKAAMTIENCTTAVRLASSKSYFLNDGSVTFLNTATAFNASLGSLVDLHAHTLTFTGVTTDYTIDGVNYTEAFLNGLAPAVIVSNKGSRVIR